MKDYKIEVTKKYEITCEDIDDIMAAAFEGGINYWCKKAEVVGNYLGEWANEQISRGGAVKLYDAESDDCWELNLENFLLGVIQAIEGDWYADYEWYKDGKIDTCQVDAAVADVIIQLALFDDVIFG